MGGLNIKLPSDHESYLEWSKETSLVLESQDLITAVTQQEKICTEIKKVKTDRTNQKKTNLINSLNETDKYAIDLASEKGASNWLNALPLSRYNFNLNKSEFRDGFYLRYGWEPSKTPLTLCQSVIFGSLTLRKTRMLNYGVNIDFSKIRMEPVMHDFLAITENRKREIRTIELQSRESCQIKQ